VPSTISLMGTIKSMRSESVDVDSLAPWISMGYGLMLDDTIDARATGALPDDQFVDVRYADLMTEPVATIDEIYRRLEIDRPPALDRAIAEYLAAQPQGSRGAHRYSLTDTGLDPAAERERFRRYQAQYDVPDEV
jgi:hypothetical protein